ncbi:unnamed protein product [Phytophthora lilii]|uniref:Unnamed protein product n=1 Tax=Phytophthora lilii TaxID=2077276 RepID=A0A9W6XAE7_9STRA|nr:unnamed protein product [Phytophthora lilii]
MTYQFFVHFSASRHDLRISTSVKFREPGHLDTSISVWEKLVSCIAAEVEGELIDKMCGISSSIGSVAPSNSPEVHPTRSKHVAATATYCE